MKLVDELENQSGRSGGYTKATARGPRAPGRAVRLLRDWALWEPEKGRVSPDIHMHAEEDV